MVKVEFCWIKEKSLTEKKYKINKRLLLRKKPYTRRHVNIIKKNKKCLVQIFFLRQQLCIVYRGFCLFINYIITIISIPL